MKRIMAIAGGLLSAASLLVIGPAECRADKVRDHQVLVSTYFQYVLSQQIPTQAAEVAANAPEPLRPEVANAASRWSGDLIHRLRASLEQQFGESARQQFQTFVADYTTAEQAGDIAFLRRLASDSGIAAPLPAGFPEFNQKVTTGWLKADVDSGAALLGEIQTWLDVSARTSGAPPLAAWLGRHSKMIATPTGIHPAPKPSRQRTLRNAETQAGEFKDGASDAPPALDAFSQSRQDRRQRALEEAQAGMQQVAAERDAAERDVAARKTVAAQAEAEAIKRQAEKLAATETEALEQRKNSWNNKLKGILSATIGAATGAFSGGLGTEAGTRMADAVFK